MKKILIAIALISLSACAGAQKEIPKVFYPAPPDPARIQFLRFYTGEKDIARKRSMFEAFVTGSSESGTRVDKPYGLAMYEGKIYVCDTNLTVFVFDLPKKAFYQLQGAQGLGKLVQPVNIRIDKDGTKFVSDPGRGQVVVFDKNDFYVGALGHAESWKPVDAIPYGDNLFVADMKNGYVEVIDKRSGAEVRKIGVEGETKERLARPTNLAFDPEGHLLVSDATRFQIVKYDRDGHYISSLGNVGSESGTFARPKGIAVDRAGRLYVVDAAFDNVQMFNKEDYLLMPFAGHGKQPGNLALPASITIDYDSASYFQQYAAPGFEIEQVILVTSQLGDHLINVYGFGKEKGKQYPSDAELLEQAKKALEKRTTKQSDKDQKPNEK